MKHEIQLDCPLAYDAAKQGNWAPYELSPTSGFMTTLIPGGSYDGEGGDIYNELRAQGKTLSTVALDWKECNIKGCGYWIEYTGPGRDAYIKSWTYGQANSYNGAISTVQTIMMNKDGQRRDYTPTIQSGPVMRYTDHYAVPLHCGRVERRAISWPTTQMIQDCNYNSSGSIVSPAGLGFGTGGGCSVRTVKGTITMTEVVTREWSGDNATDGTWSLPNVRYVIDGYGAWDSLNRVPKPLVLPKVTNWSYSNMSLGVEN